MTSARAGASLTIAEYSQVSAASSANCDSFLAVLEHLVSGFDAKQYLAGLFIEGG
jgi:hypothetical protein